MPKKRKRFDHCRSLIRDVPDFPRPGIMFKDITPLLASPRAFHAILDGIAERLIEQHVDAIVGIEARGFIFGGALAARLNASFVPVRKPGKLPAAVDRVEFKTEYSHDSLEMHKASLTEEAHVVVVDDVLATGGTALAAAELVRKQGAYVVGYAFVVELAFLGGRERLLPVSVESCIKYRSCGSAAAKGPRTRDGCKPPGAAPSRYLGPQSRSLAGDVFAWGAELLGQVERAMRLGDAPEPREGPGAPELGGTEARMQSSDGVVGLEGGRRVADDDRDGCEPEPAVDLLRVLARPLPVGLPRAVAVAQVKAHQAERVPRGLVVGPAAHGLLEARQGLGCLAPARAAQASLERAGRRGRGDRRGLVVRREGLVVAVRELEGVPDLEHRPRIAGGQVLRELGRLGPGRGEITRGAEDAHEQLSGRDVLGMPGEPRAKRGDGLVVAVLAGERLRSLDGAGRASRARAEGKTENGERSERHGPGPPDYARHPPA